MDIAYYLDHPEALDDSTFHQLSKLVEEYPYYHAARLLFGEKCSQTSARML